MKKFYFLLVAMAFAVAANAADWYLVGANYGWNDNAEWKFTDNGNGTQTLKVDQLAGQIKIKEAGTWSTSFGTNGQKLVEGVTYYASTDGGNISVDGTINNATITINPTDHTILVKGAAAENEYTDIYVVGDFGSGWSEDIANGVKLAAKSATKFEGTVTLTAETSYLKFKAGNNVYGTGGEDVTVEAGTTYTIANSGQAFAVAPGEYTVVVDLAKNADEGSVTFTVAGGDEPIVPPTPGEDVVAIVGAFNSWNAEANTTTTITDNCAVIVVENYTNAVEGQGEGFKVVYKGAWLGKYGVTLTNGEWVADLEDVYDGNLLLPASAEGQTVTFTFAVDTKSVMAAWEAGDTPVDPTPSEFPAVVYLIGNVNDFAWNPAKGIEAAGVNGVYTFEGVQVNDANEGNGYFAFCTIADENWDVVNTGKRYGALEENTPVVFSTEMGVAENWNSWVAPAGIYNITLDLTAWTVKVDYVSGITSINSDNADAEYFTLQGVRVANPTTGFYIVRRGNTTTKTYIK